MAQKCVSNLFVILIRTPARSTYANHTNQWITMTNPPKNGDSSKQCMEINCWSKYHGQRNYGTANDPKLNILRKCLPQTIEIGNREDETEEEHDEEEEEGYATKLNERGWKRMKFGFAMLGASLFSLGMWTVRESGKSAIVAEEKCAEHESNGGHGVHQHYYQKMMQQLLKPLTSPCLQAQRPYILVLDMQELLLYLDWSYHTGQRFKTSSGVHKFFKECVEHFNEIVVFAAEMGLTVIPVVDVADGNGSAIYRSVRDATYFINGHHMNDFYNLKRYLKKIIILDRNAGTEKSHAAKTFNFARWLAKDIEAQSEHLKSFFEKFAGVKVNNGYGVSQYYRQMDYPIMHSGEKQNRRPEKPQDKEHEPTKKDTITKKWT